MINLPNSPSPFSFRVALEFSQPTPHRNFSKNLDSDVDYVRRPHNSDDSNKIETVV